MQQLRGTYSLVGASTCRLEAPTKQTAGLCRSTPSLGASPHPHVAARADVSCVLCAVAQAEGKKRMKALGKVEVPQEAFMAILKIDKDGPSD